MAAKAILVLCAQALLIQSAFSQCLGRAGLYDGLASPLGVAGYGWGYDGLALDTAWPSIGLGFGCGGIDFTATSGGGLPVASSSCIPPVGVSVASENAYEGILAAAGELPFVGTVGVEGVLPTAGAGAVNYGCGNGATAMVATDGLLGPGIGAYGAGIGAYGAGIGAYGAGIGAYGAGIGAYGAGIGAYGAGIGAYGAGIGAPGLGLGAGWGGCGCGL